MSVLSPELRALRPAGPTAIPGRLVSSIEAVPKVNSVQYSVFSIQSLTFLRRSSHAFVRKRWNGTLSREALGCGCREEDCASYRAPPRSSAERPHGAVNC